MTGYYKSRNNKKLKPKKETKTMKIKKINAETLEAVHTHTHTHTQVA